jgi:hypothetical protein
VVIRYGVEGIQRAIAESIAPAMRQALQAFTDLAAFNIKGGTKT